MRGAPLLVLAAVACTASVSAPARRISIAPIRSELNADEQVEHVLNRLAFGPRPGDAARVRSMGVEAWIAAQLSPERIPDADADAVVARYPALAMETRELAADFQEVRMARRQQGGQGDSASRTMARRDALANPDVRGAARSVQRVLPELATARIARAALSERQLYEQMVDFWENHFSVFAGKGQTRLFLPAYDRDVIRPYALGRFRDLLGAVAHSPAMLFYLDNWQSAADTSHETLLPLRRGRLPRQRAPRGVNENYARELMELHTLGVDGGYTQRDVIEVARALTGWSIDPRDGRFVFRPAMHDADAKTILGQRFPAHRGIEDGEQVLDMLARHPATARHITTKLAVRFVSDTAPPALVDRCSRVFLDSDGDIRATLRCVVTSPEFFSRAAYRAKVKTPFELVVSSLRAANAAPDQSVRSAAILARLGQPVFGRQTPDGWPDQAAEWLNSGSMVNRVNFALAVAERRAPGIEYGTADADLKSVLAAPEFQRR